MRNIRPILALIFTLYVMTLLAYITFTFGKEREILTMIISLINFIIGVITGYYFYASHKSQPLQYETKKEIIKDETTN